MMNYLKNITKFGEKLKILLIKNLIKILYTTKKYLKPKIKSYNRKINTDFHNNKIPREGSQCIFLSVILIDSVFRTSNNYYPQLFLAECKYVVKKKDFKVYY